MKKLLIASVSILPLFSMQVLAAAAPKAAPAKKAKHAPKAGKAGTTQLQKQLDAVMKRLNELERKQADASKPVVYPAPVAVTVTDPCADPCAAPCPPPSPCPPQVALADPCAPSRLVVPQDGRDGISVVELFTHTKNNNLRLNITGQLNRALWLANDGHTTQVQQVDNNASATRYAVTAEGELNKDITVGAVYMMELNQNSTNNAQINNGGDAAISFTTRKAEVYTVSKMLGELYLGFGHMASFLTMDDTDYSSTLVTMDAAKPSVVANAVRFYDHTKHALSTGINGNVAAGAGYTVGNVFTNPDGLSRHNRVRYNTPKVYGFSLQSSWAYDTTGDMWDLVLRYADKWGDTKVGFDLAYERDNSIEITGVPGTTRSGYSNFNGSLGALFPYGISIQLAGAVRDYSFTRTFAGVRRSPPKAKMWMAKLGYQEKFFCVGKTAFAVDYGQWRNYSFDATSALTLSRDPKGTTVGVGVVQFFDKVNTEVYLMGRRYHLSVKNGDSYKPVSVMLFGARVSF